MGKHRRPDIPDAVRPYEEGYRKPPAKSRFKPGNAANLRGRPPKKSKTVGEQLEEVILRAMTIKAMNADVRAAETVLRLRTLFRDDPAHSIDRDRLEDADRAILDRYLEDLAQAKKSLDGSYPKDEQEDG